MTKFERELKELYNTCDNKPSIYSIVKLHEEHLKESLKKQRIADSYFNAELRNH